MEIEFKILGHNFSVGKSNLDYDSDDLISERRTATPPTLKETARAERLLKQSEQDDTRSRLVKVREEIKRVVRHQ